VRTRSVGLSGEDLTLPGGRDTAEDAAQEALLAATVQWSQHGVPAKPLGWLIQTATRRLIDQWRSEQSRRQRESLAVLQELPAAEVSDRDDS
jgi:predicted RNA polymerase sigma factor